MAKDMSSEEADTNAADKFDETGISDADLERLLKEGKYDEIRRLSKAKKEAHIEKPPAEPSDIPLSLKVRDDKIVEKPETAKPVRVKPVRVKPTSVVPASPPPLIEFAGPTKLSSPIVEKPEKPDPTTLETKPTSEEKSSGLSISFIDDDIPSDAIPPDVDDAALDSMPGEETPPPTHEKEELPEKPIKKDDLDEEVTSINVGEAPDQPLDTGEELEIFIGKTEIDQDDTPKHSGRARREVAPEKRRSESRAQSKTSSRSPRTKESKGKGKKLLVVIVAVMVVAILIIAGFGFGVVYILLDMFDGENIDLKPDIETEAEVLAGQGFFVSANASTPLDKIGTFEWNMGDGTILTGQFLKYYYSLPRTYNITLRVIAEDGEAEKTTSTQIKVLSLTVDIEERMIGDIAVYDTDGSVSMYNPQGIMEIDEGGYQGIVRKMDATFHGPTTQRVLGQKTIKDGFFESHQCYEFQSLRDMDVYVKLEGDQVPDAFEGTMVAYQSNFIDLDEKDQTVQTITNSTLDLTLVGSTTGIVSRDDIRSYPNYSKGSEELSMETLGRDSISITESGGEHWTVDMGDVVYTVEAREAEDINGRPSIKLEIWLDEGTKERNGIEEFTMFLWIANGMSLPSKMYTHLEQDLDGNDTSIFYNMTITDFTRGTMNIPFGDCNGHHFYTSMAEKDTAYNAEFSTTWGYVPPMGSMTSSIDSAFDVDDALTKARSALPDLDAYMTSHVGCYLSSSAYNTSTANVPSWDMVISDPSDDSSYSFLVYKAPGIPTDDSGQDVSDADYTKSEIGGVYSFSAAENIFKQDSELAMDDNIFTGQEINTYRTSFNVGENVTTPVISLDTSSASATTVKYAYILETNENVPSNYGKTTALVDANTGQYIYYHHHEETVTL